MSGSEPSQVQTPAALHLQMLHLLSEFSKSKNSIFICKLIERFSAVSRTFSCPIYLHQDLTAPCQRIDDMVGGFPYTSDLFPWPQSRDTDLPMQPIVQINLESIGKILGIELGTETLQVWGPVALNVGELPSDIGSFLLRLIPRDALSVSPSDYLPDWRSTGSSKEKTVFHMELDADEPAASNPRVQWGQPLQMFGSQQHFLELGWSKFSKESEDFGSDEFFDLSDELMNCIDDSPLSNRNNADYIGGFGGQSGGEYDPSYGENLLFRFNDGNGFVFAIKWDISAVQGLKFESAFTLRI